MPLRIAVSGATGRMGGAVGRLAADADDIELGGGIARAGKPSGVSGAGSGASGASGTGGPSGASGATGASGAGSGAPDRSRMYERIVSVEEAAPVIESADVLIDFSAPAQLSTLLERCADVLTGRALVVGTTGLDSEIDDRLNALAERAAVVTAANFSIGVNLLLALVAEAAARLPADRYDTEIVEAHHRRKADAPSGTALELGRAVAAARGDRLADERRDGRAGRTGERPAGEIGFHAIRGGGVTGDHSVRFLGERESIDLAHRARDRALFAEGALEAARWMAGRAPGRYSMRDVLGL